MDFGERFKAFTIHNVYPLGLCQKFLIGFTKISQVTLLVTGGSGVRTPGLLWPATPLYNY